MCNHFRDFIQTLEIWNFKMEEKTEEGHRIHNSTDKRKTLNLYVYWTYEWNKEKKNWRLHARILNKRMKRKNVQQISYFYKFPYPNKRHSLQLRFIFKLCAFLLLLFLYLSIYSAIVRMCSSYIQLCFLSRKNIRKTKAQNDWNFQFYIREQKQLTVLRGIPTFRASTIRKCLPNTPAHWTPSNHGWLSDWSKLISALWPG